MEIRVHEWDRYQYAVLYTGINIMKESGKKLWTLSFLLLRKKTSKKLSLGKGRSNDTGGQRNGKNFIVIFLFHTYNNNISLSFIEVSGPTSQKWQRPNKTFGTFLPFPMICGLHKLSCVLQQQFFLWSEATATTFLTTAGSWRACLSIRWKLEKKTISWTGWVKAVELANICKLYLTQEAPVRPC